ncbi:MAG: nucleotidyl transferase [Bacteroidetes bacterium]|nr:MAG: nucleotidyl transferase [Bacteroidota bacterium]
MNKNFRKDNENNRITTALLLAAGTGSRLMPLTSNSPKCLTLVNGQSFLERLVINLIKQGFKRLVVVTGHQEHCIREFLAAFSRDLTIEFIYSAPYKTTNNIYSLWMARNAIKEPFMLVEGDLVFDAALLDKMIYPNRIAIAKILPWMNGTTVTLDSSEKQIKHFYKDTNSDNGETKYKTVNIYSFSLTSWHAIVTRLNNHIGAQNVNGYYETVFAEMLESGELGFEAVDFDNKCWYEVDTLKDLVEAEKIFPTKIDSLMPIANFTETSGIQNPFAIEFESKKIKVVE